MLNSEDCLFLVIDIQEKLVNMLNDSSIVKNTSVIAQACEVLEIPIIITEQYPKGLGKTVADIKNCASSAEYYEKTSFSAITEENIKNKIVSLNKRQVILCGIESHICVLQSALSLKDMDYDVYILNDCSASRKQEDFETAIEYLKQENIKIINKEIALFMLLKSSKHENFKELQNLIK